MAEEITEILSQTNFIAQLHQFFKSVELENLAQSTGLVVRKNSRLNGEIFLTMNVCDFGTSATMSLD